MSRFVFGTPFLYPSDSKAILGHAFLTDLATGDGNSSPKLLLANSQIAKFWSFRFEDPATPTVIQRNGTEHTISCKSTLQTSLAHSF